ncbi:hypothetical protein CC80DRAFT_570570 [Byssothecium circinans]|uniref:BZIP domain-containing protein n=1 Tax=Byssothecium circinans TaxID=147558 RepID=A0A6A5UHZ9_9PLEO|nr:hypothetical protein CC80DRAFT_570570 [Byssothecium circinans]
MRDSNSNDRVLVPNTSVRTVLAPSPWGPVTTASATGNANPGASPIGAGPMSANCQIPPLPKPGRKPATDEPTSKRKAQNRESQRAFRSRKAAKLSEMQSQLESAEFRHREEMNQKLDDIHKLTQRCQKAEAELDSQRKLLEKYTNECRYWKDQDTLNKARIQELELQVAQQVAPQVAQQTHAFVPYNVSHTTQPAPYNMSHTTQPAPYLPSSYLVSPQDSHTHRDSIGSIGTIGTIDPMDPDFLFSA